MPPYEAAQQSPKFDPVVTQNHTRNKVIPLCHHKTPGKHTDTTFEHAHIYVQFKERYVLAGKEGFGKGNGRRISAAQKLFHTGCKRDCVPNVHLPELSHEPR